MIEVRGLAKRFGETEALRGVSFGAARGEVVGFLGPNGAGKTTTLRILASYLAPDAGSASVCGFDVVGQPMDVRRRIGYLPEQPPVYTDHTVDEYLRFCAALRRVPRSRRRPAMDDVVERCGLGGVRHRLIGNLSRGYRQRVGLAQALVHEPEVLVLDEPTAGLDPQQIREIRNLIRSLGAGRTVLLSTHILPEVAMTCDRAVIVHRGRVVAEEAVEALGGSSGLEEAFLRLTSEDSAAAAVRGDGT
ncbi:MAG: ABC transporter ATP-binding protein [Acidobacteriia bacterium]|nr:ABC transporter ATP-binding protein [Terriglobia bacterium]